MNPDTTAILDLSSDPCPLCKYSSYSFPSSRLSSGWTGLYAPWAISEPASSLCSLLIYLLGTFFPHTSSIPWTKILLILHNRVQISPPPKPVLLMRARVIIPLNSIMCFISAFACILDNCIQPDSCSCRALFCVVCISQNSYQSPIHRVPGKYVLSKYPYSHTGLLFQEAKGSFQHEPILRKRTTFQKWERKSMKFFDYSIINTTSLPLTHSWVHTHMCVTTQTHFLSEHSDVTCFPHKGYLWI